MYVGLRVEYRAHGYGPRSGVIVGETPAGLALVRYDGEKEPHATHPFDINPSTNQTKENQK